MVDFSAFRGVRYNAEKVGDLRDVVAPPYDVIDEPQRQALFARSPHNVARIIRADPSDGYAGVAETLRAWRREGALRRDARPAVYVYEQRFEAGGQERRRAGLIGLVDLADAERGVLPHERTLSGPKADRLDLLRATRMTFGQVFVLYRDAAGVTDAVVDAVKAADPLDAPVAEDGVEHRLWAITDAEAIRRVSEALVGQRLLIADGHHRCETALNFMRENPDAPGARRRMMTLVNMSNPNLVIFPIHRVVRDIEDYDAAALLKRLEPRFEVRAFDGEGDPARQAMLAAMSEARAEGRNAVGLFLNDGSYRMAVLGDAGPLADEPPALRRLDVVVLHKLILEPGLGIDAEALAAESHVDYIKDTGNGAVEAVERVRSGRGQAAFFLNPTSPEDVEAVATSGERMPQKVTYFYPKVYTGFVMHDLETD